MCLATTARRPPAAPADALQDLKDRAHARLLRQVELDEATGCWVFTGKWDRSGQGDVKFAGRRRTAHRLAAWCYLGGFDLDDPAVTVGHTCGVPACINDEHLEIVRRGVRLVPAPA